MTVPSRPDLPPFAAWRHQGARDGFEVAFFEVLDGGVLVGGHTVAVEEGRPFSVGYAIELDGAWHTRTARVWGRGADGERTVVLAGDGEGRWSIDGVAVPELDGCLDVDLESSALTNAFPMRRLGLAPGEAAEAPAAYVRALDLGVGRLEQRYARIDAGEEHQRYDYASATFDFRCQLGYDESGLVLDYPGIATRLIV
ncbi:MAG: uncharacterized protein QOE65_402 [Solirubrobacteraceae bacterium]|nr:uncharacterized protein [Solirubrobacteraceae bacterium]